MNEPIKTYQLNRDCLFVQKQDIIDSNFGMNHTPELIENGFGIYSPSNVLRKIGQLKSQF